MAQKHNTRGGLLAALLAFAMIFLVGMTGLAAAELAPDTDEDIEVSDANDTVVVDIEFTDDFTDSTEATVEVMKDGTAVNDSTLSVEDADFDDDETVWKMTELGVDEAGNHTVSLDADDPDAINTSDVSVEAVATGGIVAGADRTHLLAFGALVVGLLAARNRELI